MEASLRSVGGESSTCHFTICRSTFATHTHAHAHTHTHTHTHISPVFPTPFLTQTNKQTVELQAKMMAVVLPVLVALLHTAPSASAMEAAVSAAALESLKRFGPQHPGPFRQVITEAPQLKAKLEQAMRQQVGASSCHKPRSTSK